MVMERFTIERIVGDIALEIFLSTVVGTGSISQYQSMIERVNCRFRVRWQEWKSGVEERVMVAEREREREIWRGGGLVCRLK